MIEKLNYKINKDVELGEGMLNGQGTGKLAECRYGFFSMSYNGCEIIAITNLRRLMGIPVPLCEVAKEVYPYGNWVSGVFGTKPYALERYFRENNLPVHVVRKYDLYKKAFSESKYGISIFWNDKINPLKGIHTVCIENTENGIMVYNRSNKKTEPVCYKSLDEYMIGKRFICGYYTV